jgi:hypothetical protein
LFPSECKCRDTSSSRATADVFRRSLADTAHRHLPAWAGKIDSIADPGRLAALNLRFED